MPIDVNRLSNMTVKRPGREARHNVAFVNEARRMVPATVIDYDDAQGIIMEAITVRDDTTMRRVIRRNP
jgi:hypothetical protein